MGCFGGTPERHTESYPGCGHKDEFSLGEESYLREEEFRLKALIDLGETLTPEMQGRLAQIQARLKTLEDERTESISRLQALVRERSL